MDITIILPCYNEAKNIRNTVEDVISWLSESHIDGEVIVVDDGSVDDSAAIVKEMMRDHPQLKLIQHKKNRGYGSAIISGCDSAANEFIGYMDSDGQFHAKDFDRLLPYLKDYDCVMGWRKRRADPFHRKVNAWLYGMLVRVILGVRVKDINCAMKVYRTPLWKDVRPRYATGALFSGELFYRFKKRGIRWKEVPVPHCPRLHGEQTGAKLSVIAKMFLELFALRLRFIKEWFRSKS